MNHARARIEDLKSYSSSISVQELGRVDDSFQELPLFMIVVDTKSIGRKQDVLLSGGVHGNEPAGVWALLNFIEQYLERYLEQFRFFAYPCVNPSGYVRNKRTNLLGIDLNRDFTLRPVSLENQLVVNSLLDGPKNYAVTIDLHECDYELEGAGEEFRKAGFTKSDNPRGFWLWELQDDHSKRVGAKIIQEVSGAGIPVATQPTIFGEVNSGGVISYPEGCMSPIYSSAASFDVFLHKNYTDHAFTMETISNWDMGQRVQAHILAITTILDEYAKRQ